MSTGHGASRSSLWVTLPAIAPVRGERPREVTITSPAPAIRATSAMCGALRVGAGFFGWSEGHLFSPMLALLRVLKETWDAARNDPMGCPHSETALGHADGYSFLNAIVRDCDRLYATWTEHSGTTRWVDKTPDLAMLLAAPLLQHVYPRSRMVLMHRHPIKFVLSVLRKFPAMSLEHAVKRITSEPADFFGIKRRGRIAPGMAADFAIFDLSTVGSDMTGTMRNDLPGGGRRLVVTSRGVEYTVVNGEVLFAQGVDSGARAGRVLHSAHA